MDGLGDTSCFREMEGRMVAAQRFADRDDAQHAMAQCCNARTKPLHVHEQFRFRQYKIAGVRASHLQEQTDGKIYEVYQAESRATALRFLSHIPASEIPPLFYVIAKTPQGNVGRDVNGLFDETTGEDIPVPSS